MLFLINKIVKNSVKYYFMTVYVDKITVDIDNEYYPAKYDGQRIRCKKLKNLVYFKR